VRLDARSRRSATFAGARVDCFVSDFSSGQLEIRLQDKFALLRVISMQNECGQFCEWNEGLRGQ